MVWMRETAQYKGSLSFKDYPRHLLEWEFWGDEDHLVCDQLHVGPEDLGAELQDAAGVLHTCHDVPSHRC